MVNTRSQQGGSGPMLAGRYFRQILNNKFRQQHGGTAFPIRDHERLAVMKWLADQKTVAGNWTKRQGQNIGLKMGVIKKKKKQKGGTLISQRKIKNNIPIIYQYHQ